MAQENISHSNVQTIMCRPGIVFPYNLPQGDVEEYFEPISSFAITESGQFGPLNEQDLKNFLRHNLDRRRVSTRDVIQRYTTDINGLNLQLDSLRSRINEIMYKERQRTDFIKKRISDIEKTLLQGKQVSTVFQYEMPLTAEAKEAFQCLGSQGPLSENELLLLMHSGTRRPEVPTNEIVKQLQVLQERINDNQNIENYKIRFPVNRIVKALDDILTEMMIIKSS